jgi:hypothetical protein
VAVDILNKQTRTADKGRFPRLEAGREDNFTVKKKKNSFSRNVPHGFGRDFVNTVMNLRVS